MRHMTTRLWSLLLRARARLAGLARPSDDGKTVQRKLGERGERDAARLLRKKGYRILERNFRCRDGEIDLVAFKDGVVAFVEVRSCTEPALLDPLESVTRTKQQRFVRAARRYATLHGLHEQALVLRFDVFALHYGPGPILKDALHIQDAFAP